MCVAVCINNKLLFFISYKGGENRLKIKEKKRLFFKEIRFVKSITLKRFHNQKI